jgi:hypothetical protein
LLAQYAHQVPLLTNCRRARDLIYSSLLRSMSPEHKFSSAAKLCGEVLAGVADGLLPLAECEEVLRDALCLLASKDIKVRALVWFGACCGVSEPGTCRLCLQWWALCGRLNALRAGLWVCLRRAVLNRHNRVLSRIPTTRTAPASALSKLVL